MHSIAQPSRRQILQATAMGVAVLASGCAAVSSAAKPRVVVVGGGWGGLGAVRGLLAAGAADVTLVEPNESFMSCPLSAHFIAGHQPASDFQRSYARVDQLGARRVRERVLEIDRTKREVVTGTQRLLALSDQRITTEGVVVIKAQTSRSLEQNKTDALARLQALIDSVATLPKARKPTRPTLGSQRRRVEGKVSRGQVKALRGRVSGAD